MAEIAHIKAVDKERERKHNQKFKGFLNRTGKGVSYNSTPTESTTSVGSTATASTTASEASTVPGTFSSLPYHVFCLFDS